MADTGVLDERERVVVPVVEGAAVAGSVVSISERKITYVTCVWKASRIEIFHISEAIDARPNGRRHISRLAKVNRSSN